MRAKGPKRSKAAKGPKRSKAAKGPKTSKAAKGPMKPKVAKGPKRPSRRAGDPVGEAKSKAGKGPKRRTRQAADPGRGATAATAESDAARVSRAAEILARLDATYPDATIELAFSSPLELLVATILSAQCTDERVNAVTDELFKRYRSAEDYAGADPAELERAIHPTGFYRAKARSLIGMGKALVERHDGVVPDAADALVTLPGVGRKTAHVVLGNAFGVPALAVDTHVFRVSQRLGLAQADDADEIHDQLCALIPRAQWTRATHLLIIHGRRTCFARRPECPRCTVHALCPWPGKTTEGEPARPQGGAKSGK
jgi:endonuclease-3